MTPEERFKQRVRDLIQQTGCSEEDAINQVSQEFENLADEADNSQNAKHQIEWELKIGKKI